MPTISTNDGRVALKKGSTWGTAGDVTSGGLQLRCSNFDPNGGFAHGVSRDIGFSKKPTVQYREEFSGSLSISGDSVFSQPWLMLLGLLMGTESSPTETTGGQGDYLRTFDLADDLTGLYTTVAWLIEDDRSVEIPSWKPNTFRIGTPVNKVGSWTFSGNYDRIVTSGASNTAAEIVAVSASSSYKPAPFSGSNCYLRLDSYSTGTPLTSADNKEIEEWELTINRPVETRHVARGANSQYIVEPFDLGMIEVMLRIKFGKIDDANEDLVAYWNSQTQLMAEIFWDGAAIGSGTNRSYKIQLPLLESNGQVPGGHGYPNNSSLMEPEITFRALKASAAPSGMTGVTDLVRITSVDERSTKWTA